MYPEQQQLDRLSEALHTGSRYQRRQAIHELDTLDGFSAARLLLRAYHDGNPDVTAAAAPALARACLRLRLGEFLSIVHLGDLDEYRRMDAIVDHALGGAVRRRLVEALEVPEEMDRRRVAVTLALFGGREAASVLWPFLRSPDSAKRRETARAIGDTGDSASLAELEAAFEREGDQDCQAQVLEAIGLIGGTRAEAFLVAQLHHSAPGVRVAACDGLALARAIGAANEIIGLLTDSDAGVRFFAISALSELGCTDVGPALVICLSDPDPLVRSNAVQALEELAWEGAVPALAWCLANDVADVRRWCVSALVAIGGEVAAKAIAAACDDPDPQVRAAARSVALGCSRNKATRTHSTPNRAHAADGRQTAALRVQLLSNEPQDRIRAARALGQSGDGSGIPAISEFLVGYPTPFHHEALRALPDLPREAAVAHLRRLSGTPDLEVRQGALACLGVLGQPVELPKLIAVQRDWRWQARAMAATGIGLHPDGAAFGALCESVNDPSHWVREAAARALAKRGEVAAVPVLASAAAAERHTVTRCCLRSALTDLLAKV